MQARRGFVPDDEKNFSDTAMPVLHKAAKDVCYLINAGYDLKQASTFVGNHYCLSERQRLAIVRSVATKEQIENRKAKEVFDFQDQDIWIDGFNQIITLEVLLNHSPLFLGMDEVIRDLASLRGNYRIIPQTQQAIAILLEKVYAHHPGTIHILLDAPVSNSGRLKSKIHEVDPLVDVQIIQHVDLILYEKANVVTSDSIILDVCISWFNLMAVCLKKEHSLVYNIVF